jgi:cyanophycinase-like exopeptidase
VNDDGSPSPLLIAVRIQAYKNKLVLSGTSAGAEIWSKQTFGGGDPFGVVYYQNLIGLAQKTVQDSRIGGDGLSDTRYGNNSL